MPEPQVSGVVPSDPLAVEQALRSLLRSARSYADERPESAAEGDWWAMGAARQPPHFPYVDPATARRAGVLILMETGVDQQEAQGVMGPRLLLTERDAGLRQHPGQISFPGGGQEPQDPDLVATALRESQEETGLDPDAVTVLGSLPPATMSVSGFMVTPVLGVTANTGALQPAAGEVERVLQLPVAHLVAAENRYSAVLERNGLRLSTPAFFTDDSFIWGFTGILIDRVLRRLGWSVPWDTDRELDPRDFVRR